MLELGELRELREKLGEELGDVRGLGAGEVKEEGDVDCVLGVMVSKFWWLLHLRATAPS